MAAARHILEVVDLRVRPGQSASFEAAFAEAQRTGRGVGETEAPR